MPNIILRQALGNTEPRSANVVVKSSGISNIELDNNFNNINNNVEYNSGNIDVLFNQVSLAYGQANSAFLAANNSASAEPAFNKANSAYDQANTSILQAQAAFATANNAIANTVILFGINSSQNTTISLIQSVDATQNSTIISAFGQANSAYGQANTGVTQAQAAFATANSEPIAKSAFGQANAAFAQANTKFNSSGGTISGDVFLSGNVTIQGTTTTLDVDTLVVKDKNIVLANVGSPTDFTADGAGVTVLGSTNKTWNWVDATDSWTSSENINLSSGKSYKINGVDVLTATTISNIQDVDATQNTAISSAFSQANTAIANTVILFGINSTQNTTISLIQGVDATQNTAISSAFATANTGVTQAQAAFAAANNEPIAKAAFGQANTGVTQAQAAFAAANNEPIAKSAFGQANLAFGQANTATTNAATALTTAQSAYGQANTANTNAANASFLTSGTVQTARLGSGTANASTYLAGDNSWKSISTSSGTVSSVAITVPTGLTVDGSPITSSGTLAISLASGYSIPTTASQTNWDTAYTDRNKWDGGSTGLTAATGRTSLGGTTIGQNVFTLTNPSAVTFPRFNSDNTVSALDAATFRTAIGAGTSSTTGTVTSVAMTVPTGLSVSGTPITTSGTLALTLTAGYSIPTTASQTNWDSAYTQRLQWDGGSTNLVAATGRTSLGGTTVGQNVFTLTNPSAITFPRFNADNTVSALDAATFRTAIGAGTSSTTGTVTSVGGTGTVSGLSLSGTVTGSGNLTLSGTLAVTPSNFASQTANQILAAPNGAAGVPTFRAIVAADIPTLNQNTTGTAANVTGTVALANGGTGATTAGTARTNLGGTTVGQNVFTLTNPSAITFPRFNADNTVSALDAATFRTAIGVSSSSGTVTSVGGTGTVSGISLSGTVTSSGNLTLSGTLAVTPSNFASQTTNSVLAAPNGVAGVPTFRALVAADIPTLNQNTTGTASNITSYTINQSVGSSNSVQFNSLGVGTASSGTAGEIRATNNITAYYSDDRLKTRLGKIENALDKVRSLQGFYYEANDLAQSMGYKPVREVGLSAQDTQKNMPEIVKPAPIDDKYLTIQYDRYAPFIIEAIKEIADQLDEIKNHLGI